MPKKSVAIPRQPECNIGTIGPLAMYLDTVQYYGDEPIDWGVCIPGEAYIFDNMTVINIGEATLTVNLITEGLPEDWSLTWLDSVGETCDGTVLTTNEQVEGTLTLTIPDTATEWPTWGFYIEGNDGT